jgi:putative endonuclease
MYYVYILRSIKFPAQYYTGSTADLNSRIVKHNKGDVPHTAKFIPWEIETYFAFKTAALAQSFELYLKTGSGREFARRHFR